MLVKIKPSESLFYLSIQCFIFWILLCTSSVFLFDGSIYFKIFCIFLFLLILFRPLWGICIFLVAMPIWGGSKPQDEHTTRFILLLSIVDCAGCLYCLRSFFLSGRRLHFNLAHPLVFCLFLYWLVAGCSLVSAQYNDLIASIFHFRSPLLRQFLNLPESSFIYPWLAFFILSMSMYLGLLISNLTLTTARALKVMGCFLLGLLMTVILGLLDYYDLINLNFVRPWYFAPTFGDNFRFQHLTSLFGNPGWYAQYLVLGAPSLLVILALKLPSRLKIILLISLMIVTEFCIILIYQRGGWLSYPITLAIIWYCVYVLKEEDSQSQFCFKLAKQSLLKIAITLPITVTISIGLVYFTALKQPETRQQVSGFAQRAESITNIHDRLRYWEPTFLMARLHPLFGPGLESFSSEYDKLYVNPGHLYKQTAENDVMYFHGSAHNLYFQALAGKGFLGLFSLLGIFAAVFTLALRGVFSPLPTAPILSQSQRLILMMTLAYTCALAIYGNVGEIFYSPIGYIPFVLFYAVTTAVVPPAYSLSPHFRAWVLGLLGAAFLTHICLEFGARFAR